MSSFVKYQLPAILYAALIFTLSSIPSLSPPPLGLHLSDKFYHFTEYALFGYLCSRAFYYQSNRVLRDFALILVLVVGSLYAISDELHQSFVPGRYPEVADFVADVFGLILAVVVFGQRDKIRRRLRRLFRRLKPYRPGSSTSRTTEPVSHNAEFAFQQSDFSRHDRTHS